MMVDEEVCYQSKMRHLCNSQVKKDMTLFFQFPIERFQSKTFIKVDRYSFIGERIRVTYILILSWCENAKTQLNFTFWITSG